jgi:uncharacterized Zn-finger protein
MLSSGSPGQSNESHSAAVMLIGPLAVASKASVGVSYFWYGGGRRHGVIDSQTTMEPSPALAWNANSAAATANILFMALSPLRNERPGLAKLVSYANCHTRVKRERCASCYNAVDPRHLVTEVRVPRFRTLASPSPTVLEANGHWCGWGYKPVDPRPQYSHGSPTARVTVQWLGHSSELSTPNASRLGRSLGSPRRVHTGSPSRIVFLMPSNENSDRMSTDSSKVNRFGPATAASPGTLRHQRFELSRPRKACDPLD